MRFKHDIYDIDVYSLCESVYYSCNNDEYDYVLECINNWIYNNYNDNILLEDVVLNEVSEKWIAKMLGADDNFRSYADMQKSMWPIDVPYPENDSDMKIPPEDYFSGFSRSKDPIRRDMANAIIQFRRAHRTYKTGMENLPELEKKIEPIDPDGRFRDKLRIHAELYNGRALNTAVDNYQEARDRYRSRYGKAPSGQDVNIIQDVIPWALDDTTYSWKSPKKSEQPPPSIDLNYSKQDTPLKQDTTSSTPPKQDKPVITSNDSNQSRLSRATTWMKNNKGKTALGVGLGAAAIGGSIYAYKRFKNRPRSVIAKRIQALRGIYHKFMINAQRNPKKANLFKRIAAKILSVIDKLLHYLQNTADGR